MRINISISTWLFLSILLLSLLIRIQRLDYPLSYIFAWGDGARDYLIADHIVSYKEFPLLGPFNLLYESGVYNTSLYYYILAIFLIPQNSVMTLGVINIFLQIGSIVLIYLIAKALFDQKTALLATFIFSFNPEILAQSDYIWQPHLSQSFAYLGLFLAICFYLSGRYRFLIYSILSLAFSFAMHNSSFPWIPIFLIISFFWLKKQDHSFRYFLGVLSSFVLFLGVLYIPVVIYLVQADKLDGVPFSLFVQNINQYFSNFYTNLSGILRAFNIQNFWLVVVSAFSLFYFLQSKDRGKIKLQVVFLLILFFSPLIFASFSNKFRLHYLTLSLGVFTIFLSKIFTSFSKNKLITIVVIFLLIKAGTFDFQFLKLKTPFENQKLITHLGDLILAQISDPSSFQIRSYALDEKIFEYPVLDTVLLIPLEDRLNRRLATISDKSPYNHIQTGGIEYFIVACYDFSLHSRQEECLIVFKRNYPNYAILKNLYNSPNISMYLSKHE